MGLTAKNLPVAGNIAGPLGADGTILSLGLALEKIIGRMPAPPSPPGCIGCTANVTNQTVSPGPQPMRACQTLQPGKAGREGQSAGRPGFATDAETVEKRVLNKIPCTKQCIVYEVLQ